MSKIEHKRQGGRSTEYEVCRIARGDIAIWKQLLYRKSQAAPPEMWLIDSHAELKAIARVIREFIKAEQDEKLAKRRAG